MNQSGMRAFKEMPVEDLQAIDYVLTDIDDTVTANGMLPSGSLAAIERLAEAGVQVIPVTGRPAGWCDHIARMWAVAAVVGENGALYFAYERERRKMRSWYAKESAERERDRAELRRLARLVMQEVPGTALASDQDYRVTDLAIDFCEDVKRLPFSEVRRIVAILEAAGATTRISSIHVNAWFGRHDKLTTSLRCLRDLFGVDAGRGNRSILYAGDSPNDEPMFAWFPQSVGVANVRDFQLQHEPAWVADKESAEGFIEIANSILQAKKGVYNYGTQAGS